MSPVTRRSDGSMEKSRNDVPGHAFPSMFPWRMNMSCGERHVMSERASDKLFWVEIAGAVDAEDSYKLDIFSLPLPPIIKHVLDQGVCTEKSRTSNKERRTR
jgi:hypothetical protein